MGLRGDEREEAQGDKEGEGVGKEGRGRPGVEKRQLQGLLNVVSKLLTAGELHDDVASQ